MTRILIADDDISILESLTSILEEEGYNVTTSHNGETLTRINTYKPDLILLDIRLGSHSGSDICRTVKGSPKTCHIPVILISGNIDTRTYAVDNGADDFLIKPFEIRHLLAKIESLINKPSNISL